MDMGTTRNSKDINATPEALYKAFTNPKALESWLAPGEMTGKVNAFDLREGGGYQMSLFYPPSEKGSRGKTADNEDRYTARFIELKPYQRIVQSITFDSSNEKLAGEMIMEVTLQPKDNKTKVTFLFKNIPSGIKPEDNEAGTKSTLDKLARYVE